MTRHDIMGPIVVGLVLLIARWGFNKQTMEVRDSRTGRLQSTYDADINPERPNFLIAFVFFCVGALIGSKIAMSLNLPDPALLAPNSVGGGFSFMWAAIFGVIFYLGFCFTRWKLRGGTLSE